MKKFGIMLCLTVIGSLASFSNDFSTIYFYRIKSNAEIKKPFEIFINGKNIGQLTNDGRIKYTIHSVGEVEIFARSPRCETAKIRINIQNNSEYYVKVDGITCFVKEFDAEKGHYDFNNPNNFKNGIVELSEDEASPIPSLRSNARFRQHLASAIKENKATSIENERTPTSTNNDTQPNIKSDVDINIPVNPQTNDKTFAVIIANENYQKEIKVQYAANDGRIFKEYCEKTLGIPSKNIHFLQDATYGNMRSEIKWISDVAAAFGGEAKILFYYAGHGMPNESDRSAYLLPVDGFSSDFETAIRLDELYGRLSGCPAQSVTVFLDACFSGSVRDDGMLASARGVKIKPRADIARGNMVVFSAATGEETAYPYREKQHGLFTYFLLKKLRDTNGNVDYSTLSNYIIENVKQQAILVNQKSQTPQVNVSPDLQSTWQQLKIK